MPVIRVEMWEGRTKEQKKKIVKGMTDLMCETIGCQPQSVTVLIQEFSKENWGLGGDLASDK